MWLYSRGNSYKRKLDGCHGCCKVSKISNKYDVYATMLQIIFLCLVGCALADLDLSTFIIFTVLTEPHHEKTNFITGLYHLTYP